MIQRDYILRIAEDVGRALAHILYRREVKDYQAAFGFIDDQLKQMVGMGLGFIHSVSEETLLSMFTSLGRAEYVTLFAGEVYFALSIVFALVQWNRGSLQICWRNECMSVYRRPL